jgi:hypothetical protein
VSSQRVWNWNDVFVKKMIPFSFLGLGGEYYSPELLECLSSKLLFALN